MYILQLIYPKVYVLSIRLTYYYYSIRPLSVLLIVLISSCYNIEALLSYLILLDIRAVFCLINLDLSYNISYILLIVL